PSVKKNKLVKKMMPSVKKMVPSEKKMTPSVKKMVLGGLSNVRISSSCPD
ncbi:hypothetical protein AVEN_151208-1, partial [Araneus ventricosus]